MLFKNTKIDFLSIRLKTDLINKNFWSIVENSNYLDFSSYYNWLEFKIYLETNEKTFNTYILCDNNNNKLCQIFIVNNLNKRSDFYNKITFYWLFFNLYFYNTHIWQYLLNSIMSFFWIDNNNKITRFDLCYDDYSSLDTYIFKCEYIEKVKTFGTTWKSLKQDKRYVFRVYNKSLDVLDKKLHTLINNFNQIPYYHVIKNINNDLIRLELQFNSKLIKEKNLKLFDIITNDNYIKDKLFNNLYSECFYSDLNKIRDNNSIDDTINNTLKVKTKFDFKVDFNKTMLRAYLKNVYFLEPDKFRKNLFDMLSELNLDYAFLVDDYLIEKNNKKDLTN